MTGDTFPITQHDTHDPGLFQTYASPPPVLRQASPGKLPASAVSLQLKPAERSSSLLLQAEPGGGGRLGGYGFTLRL